MRACLARAAAAVEGGCSRRRGSCSRPAGAASLPARVPPWLGRGAARHPGIGRFLDHTLLAPEVQKDQITALCDEAIRWELKAVCVNGGWARPRGRAAEGLAGAAGDRGRLSRWVPTASGAKAAEARLAVESGAARGGHGAARSDPPRAATGATSRRTSAPWWRRPAGDREGDPGDRGAGAGADRRRVPGRGPGRARPS